MRQTPTELGALLERCHEALSNEQAIRHVELSAEEERAISSFAFLSQRPLLVVLNTAEDAAAAPVPEALAKAAEERKLGIRLEYTAFDTKSNVETWDNIQLGVLWRF